MTVRESSSEEWLSQHPTCNSGVYILSDKQRQLKLRNKKQVLYNNIIRSPTLDEFFVTYLLLLKISKNSNKKTKKVDPLHTRKS